MVEQRAACLFRYLTHLDTSVQNWTRIRQHEQLRHWVRIKQNDIVSLEERQGGQGLTYASMSAKQATTALGADQMYLFNDLDSAPVSAKHTIMVFLHTTRRIKARTNLYHSITPRIAEVLQEGGSSCSRVRPTCASHSVTIISKLSPSPLQAVRLHQLPAGP